MNAKEVRKVAEIFLILRAIDSVLGRPMRKVFPDNPKKDLI